LTVEEFFDVAAGKAQAELAKAAGGKKSQRD